MSKQRSTLSAFPYNRLCFGVRFPPPKSESPVQEFGAFTGRGHDPGAILPCGPALTVGTPDEKGEPSATAARPRCSSLPTTDTFDADTQPKGDLSIARRRIWWGPARPIFLLLGSKRIGEEIKKVPKMPNLRTFVTFRKVRSFLRDFSQCRSRGLAARQSR
jgi:hypothetical protein